MVRLLAQQCFTPHQARIHHTGCAHNSKASPFCGLGAAISTVHTRRLPKSRWTVCRVQQVETAEVAAPDASSADTKELKKFLSLLPPTFERDTKFEQYQDGLWGLTQPLTIPIAGDAKLRMTVARLGDGTLWLHNPIAPTKEMLKYIEQIGGAVAHIVVPNGSPEHWYFTPALAAAFPSAQVWVPPGFFSGKRLPFPAFGMKKMQETSPCAELGEEPPAEWKGEVNYAILSTPILTEIGFVLPKYKILTVADNALMIAEPEYSEKDRPGAEKLGVWNRLGPINKPLMQQYPEISKQWVDKIAAMDFDTVVPAHSSGPVKNGKQQFTECFSFLS